MQCIIRTKLQCYHNRNNKKYCIQLYQSSISRHHMIENTYSYNWKTALAGNVTKLHNCNAKNDRNQIFHSETQRNIVIHHLQILVISCSASGTVTHILAKCVKAAEINQKNTGFQNIMNTYNNPKSKYSILRLKHVSNNFTMHEVTVHGVHQPLIGNCRPILTLNKFSLLHQKICVHITIIKMSTSST